MKQDVKANQAGGKVSAFTLKNGVAGLNVISGIFGIGNGTVPNPYANIFNSISGNFTKIGKVVKVADFFLGLFKPNSDKVTPLVFDVNLTGNGNITTALPLQDFNWNNPGSDLNQVAVANRPVYNNIMGTFSLLKAPQLNLNLFSNSSSYSYKDPNGYGWCYEESGSNFAQIECSEPIKWVLNPSSGLSVDKLHASYVIHFQNSEKFETENFPLECFLSYKPKFFLGNYLNSNCEYSFSSDVITEVYLKIIGNFTAGNNQKLAFSSLYNVSLNQNILGSEPSEQFPSQGCSAVTPSASFSEIQAVCNSSEYTSRRDQFFKATPTDTYVKGNPKSRAGIDMLISPNPASNSLNLQYSIKNEGKVKIAIYDLSGKTVKSLAMYNDAKEGAYALQADLSDVANGMYFVVLDLNGKTVTQKLSVMKK